jgi:uncharacterized membrane protein YraQ (UPF0718 family)
MLSTNLKRPLTLLLAVVVIAAAIGVWVRWPFTPGPMASLVSQLSNLTTIFLSIFMEASAFLLFGTLASGLLEAFANADALARLIPREPLPGAVVGACLGLLFPICECGTVPLTRRLLTKGLPLSVAIAFLLSAPMFNPIVLASTLTAFGLGPVLFCRVGLTLFIGVVTGLVFGVEAQPARLLRPSVCAAMIGSRGGRSSSGVALFRRTPWRAGLQQTASIALDEFFEMGPYLISGALLASLVQTFLPQAVVLALGSGPVASALALMALAVLLSICSTVDAFIARTFVGTFSTGAIIGFLVFGPMIDIKSTLMFLEVFRPRAVVYLILLPFAITLVAAVMVSLYTLW